MKLRKRLQRIATCFNRLFVSPTNGLIDYAVRRNDIENQYGPFNRQEGKKAVFLDVANAVQPAAIVETGTFRGVSTQFIKSSLSLPIHTVEVEPRFYVFNLLKFLSDDLVKTYRGDSRTFLKKLAENPDMRGKLILFYLDAHWYKDLPLRDEIDIILSFWPESAMMVDDFQVPGDDGYGFDDYGDGKALNLGYINSIPNLAKFFPVLASSSETGAKRGCVVLARSADTVNKLRLASSLREYA
jgi:hypothetical protein